MLSAVVAASESSNLPDKPDHEWIDRFVLDAYRQVVVDHHP